MKTLQFVFVLFVMWTNNETVAATLLGPTPYAGPSDSPFDLSNLGTDVFLEDFEDGLVNTPGVITSGLHAVGPVVLFVDDETRAENPSFLLGNSVDADDGQVDGVDRGGHFLIETSLCALACSSFIRFEFDEEALGFLPTGVGLVWTAAMDGRFPPLATLSGFDLNDIAVGSVDSTRVYERGGSVTLDDQFLGIIHAPGIRTVKFTVVADTDGHIAIDHLQYGLVLIPEPRSIRLGLFGVACLAIVVARGIRFDGRR